MHRARVGYDLIANRHLHDKAVERHQKVHKERMDTIMHRKAGTGTLDNNCPHSMNSAKSWRRNNRARFRRADRYRTIMQQNKALLQRMTKVMTTGTDLFDYEQKKVYTAGRTLNSVARKQKLLTISKRNKRLVHTLETIKPYYSVEKWEEDRQKTEGVLKWMARVHYKPSANSLEAFKQREMHALRKELDNVQELEPEASSQQSHTSATMPPFASAPGAPHAQTSKSHSASAATHTTTSRSADGARQKSTTAPLAEGCRSGHQLGKRAGSATAAPNQASPRTAPRPRAAAIAVEAGEVAPATGTGVNTESGKDGQEAECGDDELRTQGTRQEDSLTRRPSRGGNLQRIKDAQAAASSADMQQVQDLFEDMQSGRREQRLELLSPSHAAKAVDPSGYSPKQQEAEEVVSSVTRHVLVKRSIGDEPQVKVNAVFFRLPNDGGLRVQVKTADEEEEYRFFTESTLSIDDARTILSLNQKKKGPLSKVELVALVTGLIDNFELVESAHTISIIFRRRLEFTNEDQFFSMVNKNLTALQQLYNEQSQEVRRSSIDFVGSNRHDEILLKDSRPCQIIDPLYDPTTSPPEQKLSVSHVDVNFTVRDPTCGEVNIVAKLADNPVTGSGMTLTLKTRVPTLALANRSAAVDYVGKVVGRVCVTKAPTAQLGWKLEILTE